MKPKLLPTTIFLLLISISIASIKTTKKPKGPKSYGDIVITKIVSVYDGDTFRVDINDFPPILGQNMPIRINGIDCPEMRDKRIEIKAWAKGAREFTENKLRSGKVVKLKNMKRGKYFRIIADVEVDGQDLGRMLIGDGLARPYSGGKRGNFNI
jgi:endonuclease YncB( thermonuclease family)